MPGVDEDISAPPKGCVGSHHDQSTYYGRLRRFLEVVDPRHLASTDAELRRCQEILRTHGTSSKATSTEELLAAKAKVDACCHPVTGDIIPAPLRMAGFIPANVPIVYAMLAGKTLAVQVAAHWANQTYNTAVNYFNRSGASMDRQQVLRSYALAVGTACPLAWGLGRIVQRGPPAMRRFASVVPYVAVSSAGTANVVSTRSAEITGGVPVRDEAGQVRGLSPAAGLSCVLMTVASRSLLLPVPVVILPAAIVGGLGRAGLMPASTRGQLWVQLSAITASLGLGLPLSIALFPQEAEFSPQDLEPEFQGLVLKDGSERPVERLYANKGL